MITCKHCNIPTLTISPITLKRFKTDTFHISGLCSVCVNEKAKFLTNREASYFPGFVYFLPLPGKAIEYIDDGSGRKIKIIDFLQKIINV